MTGSRPIEPQSLAGPSLRWMLLGIAAGLACLGGLALAVDLPVARWFRTARPPGEVVRLLNFAEVFAHGLGAAALLAVAAGLDPTLRGFRRGGDLPRMVATAFTGGLLADLVKASVVRVRPRAADLTNLASVLGTFGDGVLVSPPGSRTDIASFPSGHAAVAAGLAAALTWRYPRGAAVFATLALLASLQRIVVSAHYPSDVACGAAIGLVGAAACLGNSRPRPNAVEF